MDYWNYGSDGRGVNVLSDEMVSSSPDALESNRKVYSSWDLKIPRNSEDPIPLSVEVAFGNHGFKELSGEPSNEKVVSRLVNQKTFIADKDSSGLRPLSSNGDGKCRDSTLIGLKLGRLVDCNGTKSGKSSKEPKISSSITSPVPPVKRSRLANSNGQTPVCQVHGCNMDLSSSKDYHKKHKVCETHCKTARVIVNGIEQRFCQQCSRFHLLAEFDDGKRSCRKRLADHNERRRKPQLEHHCGRTSSKFIGTSLTAGTSFIFSDIFPSGIAPEVKYEKSNCFQNVQIKSEANTQPPIPFLNGNWLQKPFRSSYGMEKQFSPLHVTDTVTGIVSYENRYQYPQNVRGAHSMFQNASSGTKEFVSLNMSPTVEGLPKVSDSSCALSLLSTQLQSSSRNLSAIPVAWPLTVQDGRTHYNGGQFPDKLLAVSSQPSAIVASNRFFTTGMGDDHMEAALVSDASNMVTSEAQAYRNTDLFREHGHTVDLLKLSSQLDNAELQRHPMQVKQGSGDFCYHPITLEE